MEGAPKETTIALTDEAQHPFPGLRSYEEKNKSQFGGRDNEIAELYGLVEENSLTIIFGKSGIGKTSLIKAGLIPTLQKNFYHPIYIRIDYSSEKHPLQQLKDLLMGQLRLADKQIPDIENQTLWAYLHDLKLADGMVIPVIIFDQFEEIFTLGSQWGTTIFEEFMTELSDLAENYVPLVVQQAFERKSEMIPTQYSKQNYRIIISLREDFLAQLESLKRYLPSMMNSRFRVIQMTTEQALEAVIKPAKGLVNREVAVEIIGKLPGISSDDFTTTEKNKSKERKYLVEPFLLSLICYQMNEKRLALNLETITLDLVRQFDIVDVIHSYYEDTVSGFGPNISNGIENSLLTESGYRKLESLEEMMSRYHITADEIDRLVDKRIIRKEIRDDVQYVELIHDVLAPVIRQKRDERVKIKREQEKAAEILIAVNQYKEKRRRNIRVALLVILPLALLIGYNVVKGNIENAKTLKRYENLDYSKKLLVIGRSLARSRGAFDTGALVSRIAFLINKENNGGNEIDFYNSMYERLTDMNLANSRLNSGDSTPARSIVRVDNDVYFYATERGKIYKQQMDGDPGIFFDFTKKITSIAISQDKKFLAVAGVFKYVCVFDLTKDSSEPIKLSPDNLGNNGKTVAFTDDNRLIVKLDSTLFSWDITSWKPVSWNLDKQMVYGDETGNKDELTEDNNSSPYLRCSNIKCFTVQNHQVVIGIDSGAIFINGDSSVSVRLPMIGTPTFLKLDPAGKFLLSGNSEGKFCKTSLENFNTSCSQAQTIRITDIASNSDGSYYATSSIDGSIALWKNNSNLDLSSSPLMLALKEDDNCVYCITFSKDNQYILAGYKSGLIKKWPAGSDALATIIRQKTQITLDTTQWRTYTGKSIPLDTLNKYQH